MAASTLTSWEDASTNAPTYHLSSRMKWLIIIIGIMVITFTVVGNIMVIVSYIRDSQIRKMPGNIFILSLSVSDWLVGLISMPLYLHNFVQQRWPVGNLLCNIYTAFDYSIISLSTMTVIFISLDRYWMVTKKLKYRSFQTRKRSQIMVIISWLFITAVVSSLILTWASVYSDVDAYENGICNPVILKTESGSVTVLVTFIIFPSLVIIYLNLYVFVHICRRSKRLGRDRQKHVQTGNDFDRTRQNLPSPNAVGTKDKNITKEVFKKDVNPGMCSSVESIGDENWIFKVDEKIPRRYSERQTCGFNDEMITVSVRDPCVGESSKCRKPITQERRYDSPTEAEQNNPASYEIPQENNNGLTATAQQAPDITVDETVCNRNAIVDSEDLEPKVTSNPVAELRIHEKGEPFRIRRAAFTLTMLVVVYSICWTPYAISRVYDSFCESCLDFVTMEVTRNLVWLNSTVNPILYAATNPRFRKNFLSLLNVRGAFRACQTL